MILKNTYIYKAHLYSTCCNSRDIENLTRLHIQIVSIIIVEKANVDHMHTSDKYHI